MEEGWGEEEEEEEQQQKKEEEEEEAAAGALPEPLPTSLRYPELVNSGVGKCGRAPPTPGHIFPLEFRICPN
ncbi:hypothetical protein HGM15179_010030 [Zosterops borbonicus]|uniref:Uncharacterized protein n=1 Tax=Zosterops borbonicus TaxID=364589 RepID=A0A8K1LKL6_9PASS|nr:hypothetical protein HGM15179_010030 [Zosterops borbonicus]